MNRQTRMFRMLTCLALAMTGTAVLLSWMEPSGRGAAEQLAPALAAMEAEQAVAVSAPIALGRWQRVDVVVCREAVSARANVLAAVPQTEQYHFLVQPDGHVLANPSWLDQAPIGDADDVVRVGVCCLDDDSDLSFSQRVALETLVTQLRRHCAVPGGSLIVSVDERTVSAGRGLVLVDSLRAVLGEEEELR